MSTKTPPEETFEQKAERTITAALLLVRLEELMIATDRAEEAGECVHTQRWVAAHLVLAIESLGGKVPEATRTALAECGMMQGAEQWQRALIRRAHS